MGGRSRSTTIGSSLVAETDAAQEFSFWTNRGRFRFGRGGRGEAAGSFLCCGSSPNLTGSKGGCALKRLSEDFRVCQGLGWLDQSALRGRPVVLPSDLAVSGACEHSEPILRSPCIPRPVNSTARGRSRRGLPKRSLTTARATSLVAADVATVTSHAAFVFQLTGPARTPGVVTPATRKDVVQRARYRVNPDAYATGGGEET